MRLVDFEGLLRPHLDGDVGSIVVLIHSHYSEQTEVSMTIPIETGVISHGNETSVIEGFGGLTEGCNG